jgi:hypothetical protein
VRLVGARRGENGRDVLEHLGLDVSQAHLNGSGGHRALSFRSISNDLDFVPSLRPRQMNELPPRPA